MHTFLVGQVLEVRPVSRTNKTSGEVTNLIDVTVQSVLKDKNNFNVFSTEVVQYPETMRAKFDQIKGKFIFIPYQFITTAKGNYLFADENMNFIVFDDNPFSEKVKK